MSRRRLSASNALSRFVILIVGGDARQGDRQIGGAFVRAVASTKYGGNGEHRALIATIRGRGVHVVLLLARWLGHSESRAIGAACRSVGTRYLMVDGGLTAAWAISEQEAHRG